MLLEEWHQREILRNELPELERSVEKDGMTSENIDKVRSLGQRATDAQTLILMKETARDEIKDELRDVDLLEGDQVVEGGLSLSEFDFVNS